MEMKKQVLSFNEFIFEAYSMMNEGRTWSDVKTLLADYVDEDTNKILAYIEDSLEKDARDKDNAAKSVNILDAVGETFAKTVSEKLNGTYTNIVDVDTQINDITYNKVIQGSVYVNKTSIMGETRSLAGKNLGKFPIENGKMKLIDFLNMINIENVKKMAYYDAVDTKKQKAEFSNIDKREKKEGEGLWGKLGFAEAGERKKIKYSGSQDQHYITANESQIEIQEWKNNDKIKPVSGVSPVPMSMDYGIDRKSGALGGVKVAKGKKAGTAQFTYVFYVLDPKSVNPGKGKGASPSFTDVKEVKIPVKEADTTQTIEIQDNGVLFTVNTANLTEQGKKNIYNAITQEFNSVSEITIQGSASQEGDKKNNEKLCKDRAAAVKTYLEGLTSAKITASETPNIQPASPETDEATRKTWRNVILTIKGTKISSGEIKEKTIYVPITGKIKCDLVTIKELQITFNVAIDPGKAKKAKLFQKGVDTDMAYKDVNKKRSE